jgi:NAD(P)-dependent dehydrogenase (short-subunit alcohol dehydrogenase family)
MSEQQRAAIVTGASGGIGRELVLGLLGNDLKIGSGRRGDRRSGVPQRRPP